MPRYFDRGFYLGGCVLRRLRVNGTFILTQRVVIKKNCKMNNLESTLKSVCSFLDSMGDTPLIDRVEAINSLREAIHKRSPFMAEPVDFVRWVPGETVVANDYNPNKVAPPEMQLLEVSIISDGYTQPIVTFGNNDTIEVIDGFHRNRVGKESKIVKDRIHGFLPIVAIRSEQSGKDARMASTIRHNRARGKHQVSAMSEIVLELKNRNWNNAKIAKNLGMDEDEILRLCQISGLEQMFSDKDFSKSWIAADSEELIPDIEDEVSPEDMASFRIPNENDESRIFHPYEKWELFQYGFYNSSHPRLSNEQCKYKYKEFLTNLPEFESAIIHLFESCPNSCEHNLTNKSLNRIAWIGQASVCLAYGIPAVFSSGFQLLSEAEQAAANKVAHKHLNLWLSSRSYPEVSFEDAYQVNRQVELY